MMKKTITKFSIVLLLWAGTGCGLQPERVNRIHGPLNETGVKLGMTTNEVYSLLGGPSDKSQSTYSFGMHEQWVYRLTRNTDYLYFEDGVLTSWSESN